ncbi:SO_0444 family Cu/Zn efflux transporter [Gallaecimonas mangrovi]|uniref:SO_0444 family Cu/Zn efflux transporter n=1 Tax=Gallaecimonas mangrovi TaxID=2291597 RepID=UPI000E205F60|nr:SO_0444 family Cu/Zn efflux transporter [Gallaecimonas mangrovi]
MTLLSHFVDLFIEAAPWLLLGYITAALIKVWLPADWLGKHLGGEGIKPVTKAALFGAPLPLCSCGVLPAAMGLRRAGASKGATVSFMVSTPETGVDSVAVSYGLLGPLLAIVRPVAAVSSALIAGLLAGRSGSKMRFTPVAAEPARTSCCASSVPKAEATASCCTGTPKAEPSVSCCGQTPKAAAAASCCAPKAEAASSCCSTDSCCSPSDSTQSKWRQGWDFVTKDLVDDSVKWLLIGLVFAALVVTFVPTDFLTRWGGGLTAMAVMVLIGIPMYICATASTPIAAGLLLSGVSPGAVLVFLLAGPATNAAALGLVRQELGTRALVAYLAGVIVPAIAFGFLTNYLAALWPQGVVSTAANHELLPLWLRALCGLLLAVLMLGSFYRKIKPGSAHHHSHSH